MVSLFQKLRAWRDRKAFTTLDGMATRKPQITFQVAPALKLTYELAAELGACHVTRACAAGFLLMLESPTLLRTALERLRWFETSPQAPGSAEQVEAYLRGLLQGRGVADYERALLAVLQEAHGGPPARPRRPSTRKRKRR